MIALIEFAPQPSPGQIAARQAEDAESRRKGFHCLNAWTGAHDGVIDALADLLRDPDSFEHIETRITPVTEDGHHLLTMQYRARNGFGGMNVGRLLAAIDPDTCAATILSTDT